MRPILLLPAAMLVAGLSGCGWLKNHDSGPLRDRNHDYVKAQTLPPVQLPAGQPVRQLGALYPVPPANTAEPARLVLPPRPEPAPLLTTEVFVIQETSWQSWILAQREPAQVWPLAQAFFVSRGFRIESEQPQLGEFVVRHSSAASAEQSRTRPLDYLVRIQPGLEAKTTELILEYSIDGGPFTDRNQQLVHQALVPLQQYMLNASELGDSYSLLASYNQRVPQERVQELGGNLILRLPTDMEHAWPAVERALKNSKTRVRSKNERQAVYVLDLQKEVAGQGRGIFSGLNNLLRDVHQRIEEEKRQEREAELIAAGIIPAERAVPEREVVVDEGYHQLRLVQEGELVVVSLEDHERAPAESNLASSVLHRLREHLNREDFVRTADASLDSPFAERMVSLEELANGSWQLRLKGKNRALAWQDLDRVLQSEDFARLEENPADSFFVISIREQQWRREANTSLSFGSLYQRIEEEKRREREAQARKNEEPVEVPKYRLLLVSEGDDSLLLIQNEDASAATSDEAGQIMERIQQLID